MKQKIIDNSKGLSTLRISSSNHYDFRKNLIAVRLTNAENANEIHEDYYSSTIIGENNQANSLSFDIPISKGKYIIDLMPGVGAEDLNDPTFNLL